MDISQFSYRNSDKKNDFLFACAVQIKKHGFLSVELKEHLDWATLLELIELLPLSIKGEDSYSYQLLSTFTEKNEKSRGWKRNCFSAIPTQMLPLRIFQSPWKFPWHELYFDHRFPIHFRDLAKRMMLELYITSYQWGIAHQWVLIQNNFQRENKFVTVHSEEWHFVLENYFKYVRAPAEFIYLNSEEAGFEFLEKLEKKAKEKLVKPIKIVERFFKANLSEQAIAVEHIDGLVGSFQEGLAIVRTTKVNKAELFGLKLMLKQAKTYDDYLLLLIVSCGVCEEIFIEAASKGIALASNFEECMDFINYSRYAQTLESWRKAKTFIKSYDQAKALFDNMREHRYKPEHESYFVEAINDTIRFCSTITELIDFLRALDDQTRIIEVLDKFKDRELNFSECYQILKAKVEGGNGNLREKLDSIWTDASLLTSMELLAESFNECFNLLCILGECNNGKAMVTRLIKRALLSANNDAEKLADLYELVLDSFPKKEFVFLDNCGHLKSVLRYIASDGQCSSDSRENKDFYKQIRLIARMIRQGKTDKNSERQALISEVSAETLIRAGNNPGLMCCLYSVVNGYLLEFSEEIFDRICNCSQL